MAIFKNFKGNRENLDNVPLTEGHVYFMDDGSLHFDYKDKEGVLKRAEVGKSENDFDFIISELKEITETDSFGDNYTRTETLTEALSDKYGKVYVAVSYLGGPVVEVPEAISYIEFQKDLFKTQGGFELKGSGKGCQVVRNFWADDSYITGFKGGVEHCHSYSTLGFGITDCNNISHCDVSELTDCNNINDCTAYVASNQFSTISGCNYINNLIIDNYDTETYEFKNCSYLSNIAIKNSDQADIHFVYNNCTHVDPYTCYGFIPNVDIGRVRTLTIDGSINVIDPADKTYVDTIIADSLTEAFTDHNFRTIEAGSTLITALMPADEWSDIFIGYKLNLEQTEITGIAVTSDGVIFMVDSQEVARLQSGKPFIDVDLTKLNPESIVIGEGEVSTYGIAGGTTDKSFVAGLVGSTLANLVTLTKSKAEGDFSISIGANNIAGSDGGITLGYDNTSGRRGYRLYKVNRETRWIHIGSDELDPDRQYGNETEADKYWELDGEVGDKLLFCFGDNEYIAEVEEIYPSSMDGKGGVKLKAITWPESEGTSAQVFNLTRPDTGLMYWGWGGTAIGASNKAYGTSSLAYGYKNTADDSFGVAFGQENEVGYTAFTAGLLNNASGKGSAALGKGLTVSGEFAFGEGADNTASGAHSHAEGSTTTASGTSSHTEGWKTQATAEGAHAQGYETIASGEASFAGGNRTIASQDFQTALGTYNAEDEDALFIIGNGDSNENRSNAFTVKDTGDVVIAGSLKIGNTIFTEAQLIKILNFIDSIEDPAAEG